MLANNKEASIRKNAVKTQSSNNCRKLIILNLVYLHDSLIHVDKLLAKPEIIHL